jgi:hypothetical protein
LLVVVGVVTVGGVAVGPLVPDGVVLDVSLLVGLMPGLGILIEIKMIIVSDVDE